MHWTYSAEVVDGEEESPSSNMVPFNLNVSQIRQILLNCPQLIHTHSAMSRIINRVNFTVDTVPAN